MNGIPNSAGSQAGATKSAAWAGRLASECLRGLSPDDSFSARDFLTHHPECARFKSVVLEVALEEYVRRTSAGDRLTASEFAAQFPGHHTAVVKQIEVYQLLEETAGVDDAVAWPAPGDEFLGLRLRELLGMGAFSKVYLATERQLGDRPVVVKICHGAGAEAAFLGRLGHPHITPIHWHRVCERTGLSAIVMPYLSRTTMADVIDFCFADGSPPERAGEVGDAVHALHVGTNLSSEENRPDEQVSGTFADAAARWAVQLADALALAHRHQICHSDLKPSNVLMTLSGDAVLVDFSMANDLSIDRKTVGGTFPYMAPEQLAAFLSGDDIPVSFASDIYSFGATLYEFLTGRPPFGCPASDQSRHTIAEALLERQRQGAEPVTWHNPQVPESLSATVMRCLAVDPGARPESAAELCEALKREASLRRRVRNVGRRHRKTLAIVGASIMALASLGVGYEVTRPPQYEVEFRLGRSALAAHDWAGAANHLQRGLDTLPADLRATPVHLDALFDSGRALIETGNLPKAVEQFVLAKQISPEGRYLAGLGYCEARLAISEHQTSRRDKIETRFGSAHHWFELAAANGWETPAVQFDMACLEFHFLHRRQTREEALEPALYLRNLKTELDDIQSRLDELTDVLNNPNFDVLRTRVARERASLDHRKIDTIWIDRALQKHPDDLPVLMEAACSHAWNAELADGPGPNTDVDACLEAWNLALKNGAASAEWERLTLAGEWISHDLRFHGPPAGVLESGWNPADLLLNPVDG